MKIISLLPSATEIVCALGLEDQLVGRSHECDFPESIKTLPACTSANIPNGLSSNEIDGRVKDLLNNALSLYNVDTDLIVRLQPDVVITQAQCEVCAVSLAEVEQALTGKLHKEAKIVSLEPKRFEDIFSDISNVASALNVRQKGEELIEDLEERVNIIRHKLRFVSDAEKPSVACIEWIEPMMISGNWIPEMVSLAGGTPVLAEAGKHSSYIDWTDIRLANPDIIVLMPCGFSIERSMRELDTLLQLPGFADLKAVKNNRVYIADGNNYFNRPGPRIVDSVEILAEIINPKQFIFGYEGSGWIKFSF